MKKVLLFLFVPLLAFAAADWVNVKIDERVVVQFPVKPEENDMSGNKVWVANAGPDARCMVMLLDFTKLGMDSAMVAQEMAKPQSLKDFGQGILGQIEGSSIVTEKTGKIAGKLTYEYVIDMGKIDTAAFNVMHNKNVFVGHNMYSLSFYEKNGKPQVALRNKFFNSFRLN